MSDTLSPQAAALVNWSKDVTIKEYSCSCHCKKIQFKFEHPVFDDGSMGVTHCNCSICHAKGLILTYTTPDRLHFTSGSQEEMTEYRFGTCEWPHYFCPVCGVEVLVRGMGLIVVNVRTVEGIEVEKLKLKPFDGKKL